MTLHDWGHRVMYVFYQRLTRKLSSYYLKCEKSRLCVCVRASCTSPSLTATQLRQHSPPNTPSHVRVCVRDAEKWSVSMLERWTKGGKEVVSWETWGRKKRRGEDGGGESDRYEGRLRGHISEKVEWDIWKRERVTGTRRKLQLPNNDSLGKILFYISLSSLSSSNLYT